MWLVSVQEPRVRSATFALMIWVGSKTFKRKFARLCCRTGGALTTLCWWKCGAQIFWNVIVHRHLLDYPREWCWILHCFAWNCTLRLVARQLFVRFQHRPVLDHFTLILWLFPWWSLFQLRPILITIHFDRSSLQISCFGSSIDQRFLKLLITGGKLMQVPFVCFCCWRHLRKELHDETSTVFPIRELWSGCSGMLQWIGPRVRVCGNYPLVRKQGSFYSIRTRTSAARAFGTDLPECAATNLHGTIDHTILEFVRRIHIGSLETRGSSWPSLDIHSFLEET